MSEIIKKIRKRNVKVELIRIIGCFAVIWYHIRQLPFKESGELSETNVFFECICTICVMTFFLISGFFIYDKKGNIFKDWLNLIVNFLKKVFVPFLLVVIFCIVFHDFLITTKTFTECIMSFDFVKIITTLRDAFIHFTADYLPGTAAHLWYIFSYMIIILVYPITRFILTKAPRFFTYILLFVITIFMIINDYHLFFANPSYNKLFEILHKPIYYSAWGSVLYNDIIKKFIENFDKEKSKKYFGGFIINLPLFVGALIVYVITFIWLFKVQCAYDILVNGPYVYTSWLSTFSLVLTSAFILMVYDIDIERFLNIKTENAIFFVANRTLGVYLIHYLFITKFLSIGLQPFFQTGFSFIWQYFLYFIFYGLFIFAVSFATVILCENILLNVNKLLKKC